MDSEKLNIVKENKKTIFSPEEIVFLDSKLEEMKDAQLSEKDFVISKIDDTTIGRYPEKEVLADIKKTEEEKIRTEQNLKLQFKKVGIINEKEIQERMRTANYFETFLFHNVGGENGIFPNAVVYKNAEFDDRFNGIDLTIETKKEHLGIATDVTLVSNVNKLSEKLDRLEKDIENDVFAEVKYFDIEDPKGTLKVPRAIVAAEYESVVNTLKLWAHDEKNSALTKGMKIKALLEIQAEFSAGLEYAKAKRRKKYKLAFKKGLVILNEILSAYLPSELNHYRSKAEEDRSYQVILSWAELLKQKAKKAIEERENE